MVGRPQTQRPLRDGTKEVYEYDPLGRVPRHWIVVFLLWMLACGSDDGSTWFIDGQFSNALTIDAAQSRATNGFDATEVVEALQVFVSSQDRSELMDVDRIRTLPVVLDVRETGRIIQLLRAAQDTVPDIDCNPYDARRVFHFLAFDSAVHRVGYFRYYPCPDGTTGAVRSSAGSAVVYTRSLTSLMEDLR